MMAEDKQEQQEVNQDSEFRDFVIQITWWSIMLLVLVALVATWVRGISPEIILTWVLVVFIGALSLLIAYSARKAILAIGAFGLTLLFLLGAYLHQEGWFVQASQFIDWAIASAFFAIGLLAWDAKEQQILPDMARIAALSGFFGCVAYAILIDVFGQTFVFSTANLLALALLGGLYGLAEGPGKKLISMSALMPAVVLLLKSYEEGFFG